VTTDIRRHTFAERFLEASENLVTVAVLMGHWRLDTTAVCTRPYASDLERAVGRLTRNE